MINYIWFILKRDAKIFTRQNSILIGSILFPILILLFIGFGFENIINLEDLGVPYIEFLSSGIIVLFSASAAISVGYNIFYDKESNFIKEILVSPVPRIAIVLGNAALGVAWSLILFLMLAIALPLIIGNFSIMTLIYSIPVVVLLGIIFSSLGLIGGFILKSSSSMGTILGYINLPLFFLSGAFFPIKDLPIWLKIFAYLNPFYYGIDIVRYFSSGFSEIPIYLSFIILLAFTIIFSTVSTILFTKKSLS